jgi:hypothetical protein
MSGTFAQRGPATCPNCNHPIPPGRRTLCPNCHYPLILQERDDALGATADEGLHKPTERTAADDTTVLSTATPIEPTFQPQAGGRQCPSCGFVNRPGQLRCERCAYSLEDRPVIPAAAPLPPPRPRRRFPVVVLVVVLAVLLAAGLGFVAFRVMRQPGSGPTAASPVAPTTGQGSEQPTNLTKISRKSIKAKASSTLPDQGESYQVGNTLDGDPVTAWNSNGKKVGAFARVKLTYKFSHPERLQRIEIYNGYQKSNKAFKSNSRVRKLLVSTDAVKQSFDLADALGKQELTFDFGETRVVVLTIEAVYRSGNTKYKDVALSEVTFFKSE